MTTLPHETHSRKRFASYVIRQWAPRAKMPFLAHLQDRIGRLLSTRHADPKVFWGRKRQNGSGELHDEARLIPRGERREAIATVLQYLAQFVQVSNLQVLRIDGRQGVDMRWMAKQTGLSHTRIKRAIRDCTAMGWLGRYQPRDRIGSEFRGKAAIRWVTHKLLDALGLWRAFEELRRVKHLPAPRVPSSPTGATPTVADLAALLRFQV